MDSSRLEADRFYSPIGISRVDHLAYGCPVCLTGEKRVFILIHDKWASLVTCGACDATYIIYHGDVDIPLDKANDVFFLVESHPLRPVEG
jgi:hypothetical protein